MTDTLALCVHGVFVKFNNCRDCLHDRQAANNYQSLDKRLLMAEERFDKLEPVLESFNSDIEHIDLCLVKLDDRIKNLEQLNQQCFDANPIAEIEKRFEKLEEMVKKIIKGEMQNENRPFKCPVCDGKCWIVVDWMGEKQRDHCVACKFTGIVWG